MAALMDDNAKNRDNAEQKPAGPKKLGGVLATALDLEEQLSNSVYGDYLQRENWPEQLTDRDFEQIKKHLVSLIEDTQKHIKWILELTDKYAD
jgi:hypothetical protein